MSYKALHIICDEQFTEIVLAKLSMLPFDTFQETEEGLSAYMPAENFDESEVDSIVGELQGMILSSKVEDIEKQNWNETWEQNYDPVFIDDRVVVRATFHQKMPQYEYEIVINPKMSFGTGHHSTTHLMIKLQLEVDHKDRSVADFGTGTGVLGIMAMKLGARELLVTDVDDWCIENSRENFQLNQIEGVEFRLGPISDLNLSQSFDIILANINKNILLDEMSFYNDRLNYNGTIVFSGFYLEDEKDIEREAQKYGLKLLKKENKDRWAALLFKKSR